jgi:hypothetical protein
MRRRATWLKGCVGAGIITAASLAIAADHLDGPGVTADPAADIADVFAWTRDGDVVLVLDTVPMATTQSRFSNAVQYVFHTTSGAKPGEVAARTDVVCTFDVSQRIQCWIGDRDYVAGDASSTNGLTSRSGRVKVFAGLRADPFFFNRDGFMDVVKTMMTDMPGMQLDASGCPKVDATMSHSLVTKLKTTKGGPPQDFFAGKNVLSIVLEIDRALLTSGGPYVSVWASTNKGA